MFVPVVDKNQKPLMPTTPAKARKLIKSGQATPFWKKGIFCIRLNYVPARVYTQEIAVGIDPGSKKEAFTIKSKAHTYLNIQVDAVTWVSRHVEQRRNMRRLRRYRKTPYRSPRKNRKRGRIPPSTKARWQWKLRLANWLCQLFPVTVFVVEDVAARTLKGKRKWNVSFSPLQIGKKWFYQELSQLAEVVTRRGYFTAALRDKLGLKKSSAKLSNKFSAHCVDSWVLANSVVGGHVTPDNRSILFISPLRLHRRQLYKLKTLKGGVRRLYGTTQSYGFKRGSMIKHPKWGVCYVGGTSKERISLHDLATGKRLTQYAKPEDCQFLTYCSWRFSR